MELLALIVFAILFLLFKRRYRPFRRYKPFRRYHIRVTPPKIGSVIVGRAFVTDGDGVRVSRHTVRFAALDAPEWDQWAKRQDGYWFKHGKHVKSALIKAIGGRYVRITVEGHDTYGRIVGTVTYNGEDVGAWLVRNGYAIAAYGDRYTHLEREARREKRGLWGYQVAFDPRQWRHRNAGRN